MTTKTSKTATAETFAAAPEQVPESYGLYGDHRLDVLPDYTGKYVLVRSADCGVFFGRCIWWGGVGAPHVINLADARRLWEWHTDGHGITLSEIATTGIAQKQSRISAPVATQTLIGIGEITEMTEFAIQTLRTAPVAKP